MTVASPLIGGRANEVSGPPIRVLVVCTGNSARSIMAEALIRSIGGAAFEVQSAGTHPRGVNPMTLRVLGEAGLPVDGYRSKSVSEFVGQPFDYVVTVCDQAREACPIFPGAQEALHWGYDDPAAADGDDDTRHEAFRRTFTAMAERIRTFVLLALRQRREAAEASRASTPAGPDLAERVAVIRAVPLFSGMSERVLSSVAGIASETEFATGQTLTLEGEPGDTFIVIVGGRATVSRAGAPLGELGAGDFLGEIAVLDGGVRTATVTATEPVRALVVRRADVLELIDASPTVRLGVIEALTSNLRRDERSLA